MAEAAWVADRHLLRQLMQIHPDWTPRQLAPIIGRSLSWTKDWVRRIRADLDNPQNCHSTSRARKTPSPGWSEPVIAAVLAIRDHPPEQLNRVPGPKTILYYLHRDPTLQGERLPRSPKAVWRILRTHGRIAVDAPRERQPLPRPAPLTHWQLDFKEATTVPVEADGKQLHGVEILNTIDIGTSILLDAQVAGDFQMATVIAAVARLVERWGLPDIVQYDRDTRFVGSAQSRDFPSLFTQFWLCLGVKVIINPPHRPDLNGFIERYHRSLKYECLWVHHPQTMDAVRQASDAFHQWYNVARPHQGVTCANQPPLVAFPDLPPRPAPPLVVAADQWIDSLDGATYTRRVLNNGSIRLNDVSYPVGAVWSGQEVTVHIVAVDRALIITNGRTEIRRHAIRGLDSTPVPFETFVAHLVTAATRPPQRTNRVLHTSLERRTPLQRRTPLRNRTPLRRKTPLKQSTGLRRKAARHRGRHEDTSLHGIDVR